MANQDPKGWEHRALAADYFDLACRLMPEPTNREIAAALSAEMGVPVSRRSVADWRAGKAEVRASYLAAAFKLAGIDIEVKVAPRPPQRSRKRDTGTEGRGRRKLQILTGGLTVTFLLAWGVPSPLQPYVNWAVREITERANPVGYRTPDPDLHPASRASPTVAHQDPTAQPRAGPTQTPAHVRVAAPHPAPTPTPPPTQTPAQPDLVSGVTKAADQTLNQTLPTPKDTNGDGIPDTA